METASDREALTRFVIPGLIASAVIFALTADFRMAFSDSSTQLSIFVRLFLEDVRLAGASLVVLAVAPFFARRMGRLVRAVVHGLDRHVTPVAIAVAVFLAVCSVFVYRTHPLSADEFAAVFQAKIFAAGQTTGRMPPGLIDRLFGPGFLGFFFTANPTTGEVVANYWPGFALLMAPFAALGIPWLLNPVIGAGTILATHKLAGRLSPGGAAGGWAILLMLASPVFLASSISFYAMPAHLLANMLYALLLTDLSRHRLIAAGVVGSIALSLHQPYPHALFALPWILYVALQENGARNVMTLALGYLPGLALIWGGWMLVNAGIRADGTPESAILIHSGTLAQRSLQVLSFIFHVPDRAAVMMRLMELAKLIVWSAPGLPFLALLGAIAGRRRPVVLALAGSALLTLVGYLPVAFSQGHGWGNRYFYPAWGSLPVLASFWLLHLDQRTGRTPAADRSLSWQRFVGSVAVASLVLLNLPALALVREVVDNQLAQRPVVDDPTHPHVIVMDIANGYYVNDLVQNDPFLRGPTIYIAGEEPGADSAWVAAHFEAAVPEGRSALGTIWRLPGRDGE